MPTRTAPPPRPAITNYFVQEWSNRANRYVAIKRGADYAGYSSYYTANDNSMRFCVTLQFNAANVKAVRGTVAVDHYANQSIEETPVQALHWGIRQTWPVNASGTVKRTYCEDQFGWGNSVYDPSGGGYGMRYFVLRLVSRSGVAGPYTFTGLNESNDGWSGGWFYLKQIGAVDDTNYTQASINAYDTALNKAQSYCHSKEPSVWSKVFHAGVQTVVHTIEHNAGMNTVNMILDEGASYIKPSPWAFALSFALNYSKQGVQVFSNCMSTEESYWTHVLVNQRPVLPNLW